jgi:hypothetical protein
VTAPANQSAVEGHAQSFSLGSFSDPNPYTGPWTVTLDWGDGTQDDTFTVNSQGSLGSFSHTYAEESGPANPFSSGAYTITVGVSESDNPFPFFFFGGAGAATFQATVSDPSLVPSSSPFVIVVTNGVLTNQTLLHFTDPGGPESGSNFFFNFQSDYSATDDWGDGSTPTNGTISGPDQNGVFTVTDSHTYTRSSVYFMHITLMHDDSKPVVVTGLALVPYVPPPPPPGGSAVIPGQGIAGPTLVSGNVSDVTPASAASTSVSSIPVMQTLSTQANVTSIVSALALGHHDDATTLSDAGVNLEIGTTAS